MAKLNGKRKVNSVNQQVAANFFGVPKNIRDANKRLSKPGPHNVQDKRDVLNYYKKQKKKGKV